MENFSVDEYVDDAWDAEIERRQEDVASGRLDLKPGDEFLAELDERYP